MLMQGIPVMFQMKRDYFGPSFEFIFMTQSYLYDEMSYVMEKLGKESFARTGCCDYAENETKIIEGLNKIKQLSITLAAR